MRGLRAPLAARHAAPEVLRLVAPIVDHKPCCMQVFERGTLEWKKRSNATVGTGVNVWVQDIVRATLCESWTAGG